jgi:predicted nucleic acid-binding protein
MPDRIFVDTSFVLALINERDQFHEQAQRLSYKFEQSLLVTTVAVLLEIGNAMASAFRKEAKALISLLRSSNRVEIVELDARLLEKALAVYEKYDDKTWGLVDCISFVVMQERGLNDVLTFDGDFTEAGFKLITGT